MSASNLQHLTALGVNVGAEGITIADGKRDYTEKQLTAEEAAGWFFKTVAKKTPTLRRLEGGLDPARKSEGNWNEAGAAAAKRLFNYGDGPKVKHVFAFAFRLGDAGVSPALRQLGWMPQGAGAYSFLHVFQLPAGTRYASRGASVASGSEVMFPDLVAEARFTACYRIDCGAGGTFSYPKM